MWYAFLQVQRRLQNFYTLPIVYDGEKMQFKLNPKRNLVYHWVNSQVSIVCLLGFRGIIRFLRNNEPNPELTFVKFIMDLMYWGLMVIVLSCVWTLKNKKGEGVWLMNQILRMKKPEDLRDKTITPETLVMYAFGGIAFAFPIALFSLPFIFKDTPANAILRFYLPRVIMEERTNEVILSALYWLIHGLLAIIPVIQQCAITLIVFFEARTILAPCYTPKGRQKEVNFYYAYNRYQAVSIIFKAFQSFGIVLFAALMFASFFVMLISTYVVIKLNDVLPIIIVGMMGVVDVVLFCSSFFMYDFALAITKESERAEDYWRGRPLGKVDKRRLRTYRPILVYIGRFFSLYRSVVLDHMDETVDKTISFLLM